jgi:hypothetical protein
VHTLGAQAPEDAQFAIVFAAMGVNMETAHFFKQVRGGVRARRRGAAAPAPPVALRTRACTHTRARGAAPASRTRARARAARRAADTPRARRTAGL